jgi:hypothetical protein
MTAHVCDDTAYPAAAMPDECTCGGPMTLQDLKDLLATYGVNDGERNASVLVNGVPVVAGEVDWQWTPDGAGVHTVLLTLEENR